MVDDTSHFSAAPFVEPLTTDAVWEAIITLSETVYTDLPNALVFDEGS